MPNTKELYHRFYPLLVPIYDSNEAHLIAKMAAQHCIESNLNAADLNTVEQDLKQAKPIQYITGKAFFSDFELTVNEAVLIPRPETDELVYELIKQYKHTTTPFHILDIGTGSGCIAIALKKHLPNAIVTAIDISENALKVARENAQLQGVDIHFLLQNILDTAWQPANNFDIVVSNPPYITTQESLPKNVLHEPHHALFVTNNDALQFYKAIEFFSKKYLNKKGIVYMEAHSLYAKATKEYWTKKNWQTRLKKDMQGMDRMLIAQRKS